MITHDDILQIIRTRSSCRHFAQTSLTTSERDLLLRSADLGPSSGGLYAYGIYYTELTDVKQVLQKIALNQPQVGDAAIVFCICGTPEKSMQKYGQRGLLYAIQDATIVGMNITFAATAIGLGSCWVGSIDPHLVAELLKIPEGEIPLSLICIGHRKEHESIVD